MKLIDILEANQNRTVALIADIPISDGKQRYARRRLIEAVDHEIKSTWKEREAFIKEAGLKADDPAIQQSPEFQAAMQKFQKYLEETDSAIEVEPLFSWDDQAIPTTYAQELSLDKLGVMVPMKPAVDEAPKSDAKKLVKKSHKT